MGEVHKDREGPNMPIDTWGSEPLEVPVSKRKRRGTHEKRMHWTLFSLPFTVAYISKAHLEMHCRVPRAGREDRPSVSPAALRPLAQLQPHRELKRVINVSPESTCTRNTD